MQKLIIILVIVGAVLGITFVVKPDAASKLFRPGSVPTVQPEPLREPIIFQDYLRYPGEDGQSAFELLQKIANVETENTSLGPFVKKINGVDPGKDYFWKLVINGQDAQVGAHQLITRNHDMIEWKVEKIQK